MCPLHNLAHLVNNSQTHSEYTEFSPGSHSEARLVQSKQMLLHQRKHLVDCRTEYFVCIVSQFTTRNYVKIRLENRLCFWYQQIFPT